jgi:hypothetical protein
VVGEIKQHLKNRPPLTGRARRPVFAFDDAREGDFRRTLVAFQFVKIGAVYRRLKQRARRRRTARDVLAVAERQCTILVKPQFHEAGLLPQAVPNHLKLLSIQTVRARTVADSAGVVIRLLRIGGDGERSDENDGERDLLEHGFSLSKRSPHAPPAFGHTCPLGLPGQPCVGACGVEFGNLKGRSERRPGQRWSRLCVSLSLPSPPNARAFGKSHHGWEDFFRFNWRA